MINLRRSQPILLKSKHCNSLQPDCASTRRRYGFTLIELLVVISVISIIAAIVFPAFMTARAKARESNCVSNLHQIGSAFTMYMSDYDGVFPWGADPSDKNLPQIWNGYPAYQAELPNMPLINQVLHPYIKNAEVWRCPSDTGFDYLDTNINGSSVYMLPARPTMYDKYGLSYLYRTQITFMHYTDATLRGVVRTTGDEVSGSSINVLNDGNGSWHGGWTTGSKRYNVLFADAHAKSQNLSQFYTTASWGIDLR